MKKLVFNALAVVAFSVTGFANPEVIKDENNYQVKETVVDTDCDLARYVAYVDGRNAGCSDAESRKISYSIYFMCMGLDTAPISQ